MALNFPSNPILNQVYTGPLGQKWKWNGEAWVSFNEITIVPTASLALGGSGSFEGDFNGRFSGSFSGSGADLSNIPASAIVGLNLSQISSGSYSASISEAGLLVNNRVVAPSFTGSLFGTASWARNALTASFAPSYLPLTGGTVSGSLIVSGSTTLTNTTGSTVFSSNADTVIITGSLFMTGSATITGSLRVTAGITGSLFGTSSYALTASYIDGGFY